MYFYTLKCCFDCSLCGTRCEFYIAIMLMFLKKMCKNEQKVRLEWINRSSKDQRTCSLQKAWEILRSLEDVLCPWSQFLGRVRSHLNRSFSKANSELGPTKNVLRTDSLALVTHRHTLAHIYKLTRYTYILHKAKYQSEHLTFVIYFQVYS